jgi:lactate 2-monooxygenase
VDQPLEAYQDEIYLAGLDGVTPDLPTDLDELEAAAAGRLTPEAFGYIAGSAGSGETARANRAAFRRWRIVPRMLKALALGARAVLIGRPYALALGIAGEPGVRHVLRALRNDFELTMRLSGYASLAELGPESLARPGRET